MDRLHFSTTLKPMSRYLQTKNAVAAIFFIEIADSDWKKSDTASRQYSEYYES